MNIKPLDIDEPEEIYNMIREIGEGENGFVNSLYTNDMQDFKEKLKHYSDMSKGINLPEGLVPQTIYWFYVDDRPIGYGKLRHYLTEKLLEHGGHIGYVIRPSERRKNYGKFALKELLQKAREIGIQEVLLTCDEANVASRKIIEANNGI